VQPQPCAGAAGRRSPLAHRYLPIAVCKIHLTKYLSFVIINQLHPHQYDDAESNKQNDFPESREGCKPDKSMFAKNTAELPLKQKA